MSKLANWQESFKSINRLYRLKNRKEWLVRPYVMCTKASSGLQEYIANKVFKVFPQSLYYFNINYVQLILINVWITTLYFL